MCKLAANEKFKGKGAGNAVFERCMKYATDHGAKKLFMISNSGLKAALHIYHKYGFNEIKLNDYEYERGDIAFELTV
ncbi:MAG: GNAT family N-acetyltransferase [Lachnospiraceae bacterium]|nr:GNAT family N-acetyltransferase [Lachnospiraceae bacterium]